MIKPATQCPEIPANQVLSGPIWNTVDGPAVLSRRAARRLLGHRAGSRGALWAGFGGLSAKPVTPSLVGAVLLALATLVPAPVRANDGLPSGQSAVLWQVLWERVDGQGTQAILRFIAPETAALDFEAAQRDMDWLCDTHAVPVAGLALARSDSVVVTLMDRPVARGASDSAATQFFSVYTIEADQCVPEAF